MNDPRPTEEGPVRVVSYLTDRPDLVKLVMGGVVDKSDSTTEGYALVLRWLSHADDESTMFYWGTETLGTRVLHRLRWAKDPDVFVSWPQYPKQPCRLLPRQPGFFFAPEIKAKPWFIALTDPDRRPMAFDVTASNSRDMTPILMWPRNDGDNQIWRIEPVKS